MSCLSDRVWLARWRLTFIVASVVLAILGRPGVSFGQQANLKPEEIAAQILGAGNKAFNDKQYAFAVERFREYLKTYAGLKDAPSARYGLALSLLELPQRDYKGALEALTSVVAIADFPERPWALYYLALAYRGLGHEGLVLAAARPQEPQHRDLAKQNFGLAAQRFGESATLFSARAKSIPAGAPNAVEESQWSIRVRCDHAEMLIRTDKIKEAAELAAGILSEPTSANSRFRPQALYLHGHAAYLLKDYAAAGKSLVQLAPFADPVIGLHAQYLLARTHHLAEERAEAAALYDAVLAGYEVQKGAVQQALRNPAIQAQPEEKLRLETILRAPPDYVARTNFHAGVLLYEQLKFADALARFAAFVQQNPQSPLLAEAQLRQGMCQFETRQLPQAIQGLQPLVNHATLADRALLWLARAQLAAADPAQVQPYAQALATVIANLSQAAEKANQLAAQGADAKSRRAEILLDLGDAQQLAKQYPQAAATYDTAFKENHAPERNEEFLQRRAIALHAATQFDPADQVCVQFQQTFPKSTLLPAVLFRYAENAYFRAAAIEPNNPTSKNPELIRWLNETLQRNKVLLEKFPDFPQASLARFRSALAHYRLGDFAQSQKFLAMIAEAEHQGELMTVPYYHADCLLRLLPTPPLDKPDAVAAARQGQVLAEAAKFLERFTGSQTNPQTALPQTADGLLKLGYCHQRIAVQTADNAERTRLLTAARQSFEKLTQQFAANPLAAWGVLERANCLVDLNDLGGAMNELGRFRGDPLRGSPVAPLAYLRLATLQRAQNKPQEAVATLLEGRNNFEGALIADATRAPWAPLLQYHQALAVKETGKLPEARQLFENLVQRFPASVEAPDAAWRAGQCRREETLAKYQAARVILAKVDAKPEEIAPANQQLQESIKGFTETAQYFTAQAAQVAQKLPGSEIHQRMHYEAAWCYQPLADVETEAARRKMVDEAVKKLREQAAKLAGAPAAGAAATVPAISVRPPEIAITAIPIQPAEQAARDQYKALIAAKIDSPLAAEARLDLAELHARRDEHDPAIALLTDGLNREPAPDVEERLHVRLGASLAAKNDPAKAFPHFALVAANAKSLLAPEARYRAGECQMAQKEWAKAIEMWLPFRDQAPLQSIPNLSDRVLLRLGHAQALATQWDVSRQTLETLLQRFPQSVWRYDARYGIGWAWQSQKQFDNAAAAYQQVVNETATEVAAKAQYQIALCRIEQKRLPEAATSLLIVPYTYDYPEWAALALLEASRVFQEMQQPQQAGRLLERLLKDYPESEWAKTAQQRMAAIPGLKKK